MNYEEVIEVLIDIYINQNPDKLVPFEKRHNWINALSFSALTKNTISESVNMLEKIVEIHLLRSKHKINSRCYFVKNIGSYQKYINYYGQTKS